MKMTRCSGPDLHFFDGEKYSVCPVCGYPAATKEDNLGIIEYLKKFSDLSSLTTSSTVATTMIDFAYYTDFDKVLLIGFDNSYPYYQRHIKHALSYEYMI